MSSLFNSQLISSFLSLSYLGPETIMPLASILAAALGFLLLAWRYIITFIKKVFRKITGKESADPTPEGAYVDAVEEAQEEIGRL